MSADSNNPRVSPEPARPNGAGGAALDHVALAEQMPVAVLAFDRTGTCIWASREWCREHRASGTPIGQSVNDLVPAGRQAWADVITSVFDGLTVVSELDELPSGAAARWEARPLTEGAQVTGMLVRTDVDIAGAQAFGELRDHDARLQLALDAALAGTWTWDRGRGDVSWDQSSERMAEFRETLSMSSIGDLLEHVSFDARSRVADAFRLTASTGRRLAVDVPVETDRGRRVFAVHAVATTVDEHGATGLVGVCIDRTVERDQLRLLRNHEETLRMVIAAGRIGCYVRDLRAGTIRPDPAAASMLGGLPAAVGSLANLHVHVVPEDRTDLGMLIADAVSSRSPYTARYRVRGEDGEVRHIRESGLTRHDEGGARLIGMLVDETEQQRTLDEHRRTIEQLEQFTSIASHDLREPLRTISTYLTLLQDRYGASLDEAARKYVGRAVDGSLRMQLLLQDMLAYARAGSEPIRPERVALDDVLAEVIDTFRPQLDASRGSIVAGPLPVLLVDRSQFVQVIQNLVGNALKFCADEPPRIEVRAERVNRSWRIEVADNGIGVAADQRERIFEIFRRSPAARGLEGTGVGLAVCRRMIERHRGTIELRPASGESGSVFRITIPDRGTGATPAYPPGEGRGEIDIEPGRLGPDAATEPEPMDADEPRPGRPAAD